MADVEAELSGDITPLSMPKSPSSLSSLLQLPTQITSGTATVWVQQRRENVRPWNVFLNTSNFRAPPSISRLTRRIVRNIEYFQSNYLFVFLGLIAYCLITSPLLLLTVAACLGACYIISVKHAEKKLSVLGHELTLSQQYAGMAVCSIPILYLAGAGAAVFWVLGASWLLITIHAAFYNVEAILTSEEEKFELVMEEV